MRASHAKSIVRYIPVHVHRASGASLRPTSQINNAPRFVEILLSRPLSANSSSTPPLAFVAIDRLPWPGESPRSGRALLRASSARPCRRRRPKAEESKLRLTKDATPQRRSDELLTIWTCDARSSGARPTKIALRKLAMPRANTTVSRGHRSDQAIMATITTAYAHPSKDKTGARWSGRGLVSSSQERSVDKLQNDSRTRAVLQFRAAQWRACASIRRLLGTFHTLSRPFQKPVRRPMPLWVQDSRILQKPRSPLPLQRQR